MFFSSFLSCTVEQRWKDLKSQKLVTERRGLCYLMIYRMERKCRKE